MIPVLVSEGVYADLCPTDDSAEDTELGVPCKEQAHSARASSAGPSLRSAASASVWGSAHLVSPAPPCAVQMELKESSATAAFDSYIVGYVTIAIGSPLIFLPSFHLSNAFPAHAGLLLSLITGAFDASSLPTVAYRELFYASGGWLTTRRWFWGYAFLGFAVVLEQLLLAPRAVYTRGDDSVKDLSEPAPTERTGLLSAERGADALPDEIVSSDPLTGKLFGHSPARQIATSWFWLATVFLCVHMLRINLYIQTAHSQLLYYTGNAELADALTKAFTYLLPLGGIVGIPFVGYLLDKRSSRDAIAVLAVFGVAFGVLGMARTAAAQIAGIVVMVILRPLMYTAISDYAAKTFGFQTFGTVYGLANTLSGLFGLVQWPLDVLIKIPLDGNYSPVNTALLVAGLATSTALASRIWLGTRRA
ncbi:hypothetical protein HWV62_2836 [Athelia sp. TMB]|nr:hypothetical protein HWV62_2836 [Athelia sp. TMB]